MTDRWLSESLIGSVYEMSVYRLPTFQGYIQLGQPVSQLASHTRLPQHSW